MHFTRRRLERNISGVLVAASFLAVGGAAASCSSSDGDSADLNRIDAGSDATNDDAPNSDAGIDAKATRDAGGVDASPLPIACASPPCATALVTTFGAGIDDRSEGFCTLLDDGAVACWGAGSAGQLGRAESTVNGGQAARVAGLSDVVMLDHTCAVDKNGAVWCWGTGPFLRPDGGAVTTERTPVKLDLPPATKVGVGYANACAAVTDGVLCWGSNTDGQLHPLTTTSSGTGLPTLMPIPPGAPVRAIALGTATFVLREDGTLVTWGANPPIGRISPMFPDPYPQSVGLDGISTVDQAYDNACATAGGTGYCWGAPVMPPRGDGPPIDRALPEPIVTPKPIVQIATTHTYVVPFVGIQRYRWCAASVSGDVYCWGFNENGQAGDGTQNYVFDAIRVQGLPERAAQVKTTPSATCALLTNGKVYCWGANSNGQLGTGQSGGRSLVPVEVVLP